MTPDREPAISAREPLPEGYLDYQARCAIRDLIRLYGFEHARELVANYLLDEADRRPRNG